MHVLSNYDSLGSIIISTGPLIIEGLDVVLEIINCG